MRPCPVCTWNRRTEIFSMGYKITDGWTLPSKITWVTCDKCKMIYGICDATQADFDKYYIERYGYGVSNPDNIERLKQDALWITSKCDFRDNVVDFGGGGDDGKSVLVDTLQGLGFSNTFCIQPNDTIPADCDIIYASHVLEHIYELNKTMKRLTNALAPDGLLIVDVPDATGLLNRWRMPILDFNTKHLNHFTLRNLLDLGMYHGLEAVYVKLYELEFAPCYQVHFKRLDVARKSAEHIAMNDSKRISSLLGIKQPVNIWGMSDIVWHTIADMDIEVLNYIDNDPAYRGQSYNGKPVLERPDNDAPIVIMAQGQRKRLIENIRKMGITSEIIQI